MTPTSDSTDLLDRQLEQLASVTGDSAFDRVRAAIDRQRQQHRRHLLASLIGMAVAAIGAIHFFLKGDPFGLYALGLTTIVLLWSAVRAATAASSLYELDSRDSLLDQWRKDLDQQLGQTLHSQWIALLFSVLTGWVLWRHGLVGKSALYLVTSAAIWVFAGYQWLWKRPMLKRERSLLDDD